MNTKQSDIKKKTLKYPRPPSYPWKVRNDPDLPDSMANDKKIFIDKWLSHNNIGDSKEERKKFLSRKSYPSAWVKCYQKSKKCDREEACFEYIKLHIISCYAAGCYADDGLPKRRSKRDALDTLHAEHDWNSLKVGKKNFYRSWGYEDTNESESDFSGSDSDEEDMPDHWISTLEVEPPRNNPHQAPEIALLAALSRSLENGICRAV